MVLNVAGEMVHHWYHELENKFERIKNHEMVIMPNHIHFIIEIKQTVGADLCVRPNEDEEKTWVRPNMDEEKTWVRPNEDDEEACVRPNVNINKISNTQSRVDMQSQRADTQSQRADTQSQRADTQSQRADTQVRPYVGDVVQWFKTMTTNAYIKMVKNGTCPPFNKRIWQRNYHEHIVRDDVDYARVTEYTVNNPLTWEDDVLSKS